MLTQVVLCVAGLLLLALAADHLVLGCARLAEHWRISATVIGVLIIGLGTSAPEFLVSALAARRGDTGLAVGNLVGSNIVNLTLVLGAATLLAPIVVASAVLRREAPLAVAGVAALTAGLLAGLTPAAGAGLAVVGAAAITMLLRTARTNPRDPLAIEAQQFTDGTHRHVARLEALRALAGLAGTLSGAQLLVVNASGIAARLHVAQAVIGSTVVALGTSLPELVTAIQAQRRSESDLLVGNLLGSNLFNSLIGGAIVGLMSTGGTMTRLPAALVAAMPATTVLAWVLLARHRRLTRPEAAVLLAVYAALFPLLATAPA